MEEIIQYLKSTKIIGIQLYSYLYSFIIILISLIVSRLFSNYIVKKLHLIAEKTKSDLDNLIIDIIKKPLSLLIIIIGILLANQALLYPENLNWIKKFISEFIKISITVDVAWFFFRAVDALAVYIERFTLKTKTPLDDQMAGLIKKSLKVLVMVSAVLVIIQNLGYSISGMVAGLGIGGLAIALAAKEFIANFFGFMTILLDNPFRIGDWVKFGETEGDVEDIGFRSTKIRGFDKTVYTVPNSTIANAIIQNYQRMPKRRIKEFIGISYDSKTVNIKKSLEEIREYLSNDGNVHQEFFLVNFRDFGENSLNIMIYYFTKTTIWKEYEEIREFINLRIMEILEKNNIQITRPTVLEGKVNIIEKK